MIVLPDGSYIVQEGDKQTLYGEAYLFKDEKLSLICKNNEKVNLQNIL